MQDAHLCKKVGRPRSLGLAVSVPQTVQQPTGGAAPRIRDRLRSSIITIIVMMIIINLYCRMTVSGPREPSDLCDLTESQASLGGDWR